MSKKEIQIPKDWKLKTIIQVCDVNPSKSEIVNLSDDTLVSFIPMKNVDDKQGMIKTRDEKPLGTVRKGYTYFKNNDVIFAKITPCMENGKIAIGSNLRNGIGFASTEFHVLRPHDEVLSEWIHYFLRNESFRKEAKEHFTGSAGQQRVPKDFLENHIIPVPKISVQKKIVKKLDHILGKLDEKKKKISELQEKNNEKVKYLEKNLADNTIDQIITFDNPKKNWISGTVDEFKEKGYIIEFQDGNHGELHPKKSDFSDIGRPFITAKQIDEKGNVNLDECKRLPEEFCQTLRIGFTEPNDVLFTHNAIVGRVAILPSSAPSSIVGTSVTYYRLNSEKIYNKFFFYLLRSRFIRNQYTPIMKQTTRNQFSKLKQAKLNLVIPPLNDQIDLVKKLENLFIKMNDLSPKLVHLQNVYQKINRELDFAQESILNLAFSGKLVN